MRTRASVNCSESTYTEYECAYRENRTTPNLTKNERKKKQTNIESRLNVEATQKNRVCVYPFPRACAILHFAHDLIENIWRQHFLFKENVGGGTTMR